VHVDYGTTTSYGSATPEQVVGNGSAPLAVSANLSGLAPSTTYHFRVTATNGLGTASGADRTFRTSGSPVAVTYGITGVDPSDVAPFGAVNPNGSPTNFWFQYGTSTAYGRVTAAAS